VSIIPFVARGAFDPEALQAMGIAFDNACKALGLADRIDPVTETVALRIIELARTGIRDPEELERTMLASFKQAS
jgi:hypothetical protein